MNSHIQLPCFIIRNFAISPTDGNVHALDLKSGRIFKKTPRKLGTEENYYDREVEDYFSKTFEKPLGDLIARVEKCHRKPGESTNITLDDYMTVGRFMVMLLVRDPALLDTLKKYGDLRNLDSISKTPSDLVRFFAKDNSIDQLTREMLGNNQLAFVFNETNTSFISSTRGFSLEGTPPENIDWWLPFGPKLSFHFVSKPTFEKRYKEGNHTGVIYEDKVVRRFNDILFKSSLILGAKYIFSDDKSELERLDNLT